MINLTKSLHGTMLNGLKLWGGPILKGILDVDEPKALNIGAE